MSRSSVQNCLSASTVSGQLTRRSHHRCHGVSTARRWYVLRTQWTAAAGASPSRTASAASAVLYVVFKRRDWI
jgi:hypothetical protein